MTDYPTLGYSIQQLTKPHGPYSRSHIYELLKAGKLRAKKDGRKTIVLADSWRSHLDACPDYEPQSVA